MGCTNIYRYIDISMRIEIVKDRLVLTDEVEVAYEKRVTPSGTSAKVSVPSILESLCYNPQRLI